MTGHALPRAAEDVAEICTCGAAFVIGYHLDAVKVAHLAAFTRGV